MLILSRKCNEGVFIARTIRVSVVEIKGDKIRLGFEADPSVEIHREEVLAEILKKERGEYIPRCACGNTLRKCDELNRGTCGRCFRTGGC